MTAYRDRYAELEKKGATVVGVSMDDRDTLARFKKELNAPYPFIPDPEGKVAALFGVKGEKTADRKSFVIGEGRKVLGVESGLSAIDPDDSIASCPLRKPKPAAPAAPATPPPADAKPAPKSG
jgi:thioredoxin-dependent peroxiredoxin